MKCVLSNVPVTGFYKHLTLYNNTEVKQARLHFTDEEIESQQSDVTSPRLHI